MSNETRNKAEFSIPFIVLFIGANEAYAIDRNVVNNKKVNAQWQHVVSCIQYRRASDQDLTDKKRIFFPCSNRRSEPRMNKKEDPIHHSHKPIHYPQKYVFLKYFLDLDRSTLWYLKACCFVENL